MATSYSKREMNTICHFFLVVMVFLLPELGTALSNVAISVPRAVKRGGNATLSCTYDLEDGNLYSVKWYKGKYEFYRYMPSGSPNIKVFVLGNLRVDTNVSNQTHLLLLDMQPEMSGKYTCEISMDAPDFTTAMISGELGVVELPKETAVVTGIQPRYRIGDLVDGNCSIKYSKPAANLTWTINGAVVPPHHIKTYQIEKHDNGSLESVMSALNFMVTTQHFFKGQMRLKCTANIFNIFKEEIENVIEEDRPRIMASGQSYDINNYPYEQQHTNGDGFEDHNESYLTYYSAADTTSGTTKLSAPRIIPIIRKYCRRVRSLLQIFLKRTHDLAIGLIPLTPSPSPLPLPSTLISTSSRVKTVSHLSTWWTVFLRMLQVKQQNNNEQNNASFCNVLENRERVEPKGKFVISPIASCYVTLTIILAHHFMSCRNTEATKVATAAKATEIVSCDIRTNSTKRTQTSSAIATATAEAEAEATATPSTACNNKSFYNCPESVKANENKARKLSMLEWQTSMKERRRQKRQRQWKQQQSDSQCDDNIYDDSQQQRRGQQKRKAHSQVSNRVMWTCPAILDTSTKSMEKYIRISDIAEPDALLSLSKDQILLMTSATIVLAPMFPSSTFFESVIAKTTNIKQMHLNAFDFFQSSFQASAQTLHYRSRCQYDNC